MNPIIRNRSDKNTLRLNAQIVCFNSIVRLLLGTTSDLEVEDLCMRFGRVGDPFPFKIKPCPPHGYCIEWQYESIELVAERIHEIERRHLERQRKARGGQ